MTATCGDEDWTTPGHIFGDDIGELTLVYGGRTFKAKVPVCIIRYVGMGCDSANFGKKIKAEMELLDVEIIHEGKGKPLVFNHERKLEL